MHRTSAKIAGDSRCYSSIPSILSIVSILD